MFLPDTPQDHDNRMYEVGLSDGKDEAAKRIAELEAIGSEETDYPADIVGPHDSPAENDHRAIGHRDPILAALRRLEASTIAYT